jgi:hypothetical protein
METDELKENYISVTLSTINPTWTDTGTNLAHHGVRLVANHLIYIYSYK